jgi:hypothetical protein
MATILGHDVSDIEFWALPWSVREDVFRALRAERPFAFFDEPEMPGFIRGPGYYAVTRHADVVEMSRRPEVFCSGQGAVSILDMPPIMAEFYGSISCRSWPTDGGRSPPTISPRPSSMPTSTASGSPQPSWPRSSSCW